MHSADNLAEMRTKFHIIQVKLIMSVLCFTVLHCAISQSSYNLLQSYNLTLLQSYNFQV